MNQELAVAVEALDLDLQFFDGPRQRRRVFLHVVSGSHKGPETLGERLNDAQAPFLPCQSEAGLELVNLDQVAYLSCSAELPELVGLDELGCLRTPVHLELARGETLQGELCYRLPAGSRRTSDLFNARGERFLLLVAGRRACYVNRQAVVRVLGEGEPWQ